MPQYTFQLELGSDTREARIGVLPRLEFDRDDDSWSAKLALIDRSNLKLSVKGTFDDTHKGGFEVPASVVFSDVFYVTTDLVWTRASQTYVAEFNLTPTKRLTLSPTFYYDTKAHGALYAAWVPQGRDNVQFDLGYDQRRLIVGISTAFNLKRMHR